MFSEWLFSVLYFLLISFALTLLVRIAPPRSRLSHHKYDESQAPKLLPTGIIGGTMVLLGICIALLFFPLRRANHLWAGHDGPAILTQYAPWFIWLFFPMFAALAIPWPLVVWQLQRAGRWEEAEGIEDDADRRGGVNMFQVVKWAAIGLVGPIAFFTVLAIPIHLSIDNTEVRLGHYASLRTEHFPSKMQGG